MRTGSARSRLSIRAAIRAAIRTFTSEVYSSLGMATLYTNRVLTSQMAMPRDISISGVQQRYGLFAECHQPGVRYDGERQRVRRQLRRADYADDANAVGGRERRVYRHDSHRGAGVAQFVRHAARQTVRGVYFAGCLQPTKNCVSRWPRTRRNASKKRKPGYLRVLEAQPEHPKALYYLGLLQFHRGDTATASSSYSAA